jgi:hypothetical protein
MKESKPNGRCSLIYQRYFSSVLFRLLFVVESAVLIHFAICVEENFYFLLLSVFIVCIVADGFYVIYKRKGVEHSWFSISLMSCTCVYIITIWVLVFYKLNRNDTMCKTPLLKSLHHRELCIKVCLNMLNLNWRISSYFFPL